MNFVTILVCSTKLDIKEYCKKTMLTTCVRVIFTHNTVNVLIYYKRPPKEPEHYCYENRKLLHQFFLKKYLKLASRPTHGNHTMTFNLVRRKIIGYYHANDIDQFKHLGQSLTLQLKPRSLI